MKRRKRRPVTYVWWAVWRHLPVAGPASRRVFEPRCNLPEARQLTGQRMKRRGAGGGGGARLGAAFLAREGRRCENQFSFDVDLRESAERGIKTR